MDHTATLTEGTVSVRREFERSRLTEDILAAVYERLEPIVCRRIGSVSTSAKQGWVVWEQRQARRS